LRLTVLLVYCCAVVVFLARAWCAIPATDMLQVWCAGGRRSLSPSLLHCVKPASWVHHGRVGVLRTQEPLETPGFQWLPGRGWRRSSFLVHECPPLLRFYDQRSSIDGRVGDPGVVQAVPRALPQGGAAQSLYGWAVSKLPGGSWRCGENHDLSNYNPHLKLETPIGDPPTARAHHVDVSCVECEPREQGSLVRVGSRRRGRRAWLSCPGSHVCVRWEEAYTKPSILSLRLGGARPTGFSWASRPG
jgi:hypothetical protein